MIPLPLWEGLAPAKPRKENLIYLFTYGGFRRGGSLRGGRENLEIYPVFQEDILDALRKTEAEHLVISGKGVFLALYLDRVSWAEREFQSGSTYIYGISTANLGTAKLPPLGQFLCVRGPDGTGATFVLTDKYKQYEVTGEELGEEDHTHFYTNQTGVFFLNDVSLTALKPDGGNWELLSDEDRDFETELDWYQQGNHSMARVQDEAAPRGSHVLKVTATGPGDSVNKVGLSRRYYVYRQGQPNVLKFHAKSEAVGRFLCINDNFSSDLTWLKENHPKEYATASQFLTHVDLDPGDLTRLKCRISQAYCP